MALIHFAITLFISAFILFLVQPLIGKLVLPKLGGTPQVWNTCMVFFQMVLLFGYGYTHYVSTKLKPRAQVILHAVVILLPFLIFMVRPFWFIREWTPPLGGNPVFATLLLLAEVVGIPFFVVSTTAPLLQKWFGFTGHEAAKDPYFLYGASNLGSMLALLVYPVAIEPFTYLNTQSIGWMAGYAALAAFVFAAVAMVWKPAGLASAAKIEADRPEISTLPVTGEVLAGAIQSKPSSPKPAPIERSAPDVEGVDGMRRLRWVALAAIPSSMMLGVTSHITTDLSPMPMFWLIPLAFYLLSFILVFARWPVVWVEKPHTVMLVLQPIFVALMILVEVVKHYQSFDRDSATDMTWGVVTFNLLAFAFTVMVCHGELAKDRPSVRYLTDFYLMMSVGGVIGGIVNGLIAPLLPWVFELNLALIAACLMRPNLTWGNWLDNLVSGLADKSPEPAVKGKKGQTAKIAKTEATEGQSYFLDVAVGVAVFVVAFVINMTLSSRDGYVMLILGYVVVLLIAIACFARGLRFGLAIAGIVLAFELYLTMQEGKSILYRTRSYFGVIRVNRGADQDKEGLPYRTLMHGHINHGQNYVKNADTARDFSRLATTYYHRKGPAGIVMELFNWGECKKDPVNVFSADNRMPLAIVGQGAFSALGTCNLPLGDLVECWSEPPYATIGLGTGTMASYARPFQHCHFYEIDDQIRRLSTTVPNKDDPYFNYIKQARDRGANVQVLMGDARQRMAMPYKNFDETEANKDKSVIAGGPQKFYKMMVVDAFSSDAIPAHLLTEEAFKMYFDHLTEDGVLCVHTSNRFVDLPRVVADVAKKLDLVALRGNDSAPMPNNPQNKGRFQSEWVMVARKAKPDAEHPNRKERDYVDRLKDLTDPNYAKDLRTFHMQKYGQPPRIEEESYWTIPKTYDGKYLWTDDYYNLLSILRIVSGPRDR